MMAVGAGVDFDVDIRIHAASHRINIEVNVLHAKDVC